MQSALKEQDRRSRRYRLATQYAKYLDREQKPYIHLYDGGLSDNIGLRTYLNMLSLMGGGIRGRKTQWICRYAPSPDPGGQRPGGTRVEI